MKPSPSRPSAFGWAFMAIVLVAFASRLWDLGGRTLHYDEILHAWYSWRFAEGMGYSHTPLTHGPFLFHGAALSFKFFGSSDVTVRLLPALFGAGLVMTPYLLRSYLGNVGTLATSLFLTASPSILYFSRFIRNDIFMAVWALLLFAIMWKYMKEPSTRLLVAWATIWALAYTTKESAFLLMASFSLFLFIKASRDIWDWARGAKRLSSIGPSGDLLIVLGTLSLPLWAPVIGLLQHLLDITLVNPDPNDPRIASGEVVRTAVATGAPAGGALFIALVITISLVAISIAIGLQWDRKRWPWLAAIFVGVTVSLFTSMFTNGQGFFTGYWGSLGYWIAQQPVERAGQPFYYYAIGLITYEFLVVIPACVGGIYLAIRGSLFDRTIVGWSLLTFALFSFAGERMPWLLVGITVPIAIVAGRTTGSLVDTMRKTRMAPAWVIAGFGLTLAIPFFLVELLQFEENQSQSSLIIAGVICSTVILVSSAIGIWLRKHPAVSAVEIALGTRLIEQKRATIAALGVGVLAAMLIFSLFVAGRASYSYAGFERPSELLVYSQTGQETTYASQCIDLISQRASKKNHRLQLAIGESDNFAWQWRWYVRDFDQSGNVQYRSFEKFAADTQIDADIVLISSTVEARLTSALRDFTHVGHLNHLWWFPNTAYKGITPMSLLHDSTQLSKWRTVINYFIHRDFQGDMYRSQGAMYVKNRYADIIDGCTKLRSTAATVES